MNLKYKQLTLNESLKIIKENNYCHIAFSKNNKPYLLPMNYNIYKNENYNNVCYFEMMSLRKCKKMEIIEKNNFVNINVEEVVDNCVFSVMCYGRVINIKPYNDFIIKIIIKIDYISGRVISNNFI